MEGYYDKRIKRVYLTWRLFYDELKVWEGRIQLFRLHYGCTSASVEQTRHAYLAKIIQKQNHKSRHLNWLFYWPEWQFLEDNAD